MELIRLQKYIASCGVASRRSSEELIISGRVRVNGHIVNTLGSKVSEDDLVEVDGKPIALVHKKVYIMLNKPAGVITAVSDKRGNTTVVDLIKDEISTRLLPVGRLDKDTEGLLILTNDGDAIYALTHPKHTIEKTYIAVVSRQISPATLDKLQRPMIIDGYKIAPPKVELLREFPERTELSVTIHEGRNRQIRKMFDIVGHRVLSLKRVSVGMMVLGNLPLGRFRYLTKAEISYIMRLGKS